ncbi:MAG TPA: acyl-CoA dehydrogenase family protein [Candidatus Binataceae bacterium]|nr:acyl-CoA dehydrogenase family protein [Candidatus Binataceae bacterium]
MADNAQALYDLASRLAAEFAPRAASHDRSGEFPFENIAQLKESGYSALLVPQRYGGLGADLLQFIGCQERLAQGCAATTLAINMHLFGIGSMLDFADFNPRQERFLRQIGHDRQIIGGGLSEPETGGDWGLFATKARLSGDHFVLNGRKVFTSLAPVIDLFMVLATIEDDGPPSSATFFIPRGTAGLEIVESWDAMGMRATASHDLKLTDVKVPVSDMTGRRPLGPIGAETVSLFAWFSLSIAAIYTGIAIAALDFTRAFAAHHRPLTQPRPISFLPAVQFAVAQAQTLVAQSQALYRDTAQAYQTSRASFEGEAGLARVVMVKYAATNNALAAIEQCAEVVGAHGFLRRHPLERMLRDVHAGIHHPLSNARARELIGKSAFGIPLLTFPRW